MKAKLLLLFMMLSFVSYAQVNISGKVTDENDQALPGVNVLLKGTSSGTVTDVDGAFKISAPENSTLILSFIGYSTQEIAIGNQTSLSVKMAPDITALGEVVVIGYGTRTKKELTGAVSAINGKELVTLNPSRIDQALQGQVTGVNVAAASGSPGGAWNIRIRGLSTNGNNDPLIIVDGVQYPNPSQALNALNPSDVESVSVLKDGTAGIYGVRAANGVIIITTKSGKRNSKTSVEFSGYIGQQETAKKLNLLNATEYAVLKNEAFAAGGQAAPFANTNLGAGTDWQNEVFKSAPIRNYNINVNGGGEKSSFSIGGSYFDQEGIVGGEKAGYRRYNARVNFTTDLAKTLTLQNVLLFANERRSALPENTISSVLYNTINASPAASPRDADGNFTYLEEVNDVINPLAQMANSFNRADVNKIVGKEELTYKINENFTIIGSAGYNYAVVDDKSFSPLVYYGSGKAQNTAINADLDPPTIEIADGVQIPVQSRVTESRSTYLSYNFEAYINYQRTFGDHGVKGTLGTSAFGNTGNNLTGTGYNVPYNSIDFADISATDGTNLLNSTSSWEFEERLQSFFMRGEYAFKQKYLLSALIRRDGSTQFGPNNKFGYFTAVSAAWVVSDEAFFANNVADFLKLRASYGSAGNDKIQANAYRGLLGGEGVYPFNDQLSNGIAPGTLGNPDLKWETTHQTNIGFDLSLLDGHIDITTDYYIKKTSDLLFQPDVSGLVGSYGAGGNPPYINGGDVRNRGFEFHVGYNGEIVNDLKVNVGYNLTTFDNQMTRIPAAFYEFGAFGVGGSRATRMQVGHEMGAFYGYKVEGVYQTDAQVTERGVTQTGAQAGDFIYADLNGDKNVSFGNDTDRTFLGSPIPDFTMGLNFGVEYKGVDFSCLLYSSLGNEVLRNYERQQPLANTLDYKINRWTGEGSTNSDPRLTTAANNNAVISDYFVEDGSFLRMRNIQLGYSLPSAVVSKIGATKVRFYVAANNLFTITKYKGFDPDFASYNPLVSGIDYGFYPQARTYMAGLNLNF
jgi:TonB-dependent starch-binding outer membrane protein SusC